MYAEEDVLWEKGAIGRGYMSKLNNYIVTHRVKQTLFGVCNAIVPKNLVFTNLTTFSFLFSTKSGGEWGSCCNLDDIQVCASSSPQSSHFVTKGAEDK